MTRAHLRVPGRRREPELCVCAVCSASSPARAAYAARVLGQLRRDVATYILPDPVPSRGRVSR